MEESFLYPNQKLVGLLEKMAKPIDKCTINLEVGGVFAFPPEWKAADDVNPTLFSYKVNFQGIDITEGKIIHRELTDQEKKEIEEAQAAKKKPAKDSKKKEVQPEPPQLTPEEIERQRIIEEERLEAERKAQEEWDALSEQEKFWRTHEDKYKHDSLKWEHNQNMIEKEGEDLVVFEEDIEQGGAWLYFTKFPTATEEEMVKMRKSKPKNLNLMDLNHVNMRAWIDLTPFQTPGLGELIYRAKVERFYNPEDKPEELPNPNLENTYILVTISLDPPITPLITDIQPKVEDMVPKPRPIVKPPPAVEVVNDFRTQLVLTMESLAMEFSGMFGKEMNLAQEPKAKLHLSAQQKRDIREQRKEKFLYDFNTTGKYNILKEKMKKSIMKIVRDRFGKTGSLTGVTADSKDQFYSELYTFLNEQMRSTLNDLVQEKKDELHEDLVVSAKQAGKERDAIVTNITKETESDKELRLATENEIVNRLAESEKAYKGLLNTDQENHKNAYMFCQYLLRRRNFTKAEEILYEALRYNNDNREYIALLVCLQARRGRKKEAIIGLNWLLERDPFDSFSNTLMTFMYSKLMNEPRLGKKYWAMAQRVLMRKLNYIPPKVTAQSVELDNNNIPANKAPSMQQMQHAPEERLPKKINLTSDQTDELWIEVVEYLVRNGIYDLAEQMIEEIQNKDIPRVEFFRAQICFMKGDFDSSLESLNKLINDDPKNSDYLITKANYCFEKDSYDEAEETFIRALKLKTTEKSFDTFLRLGYTLLYRKAWGDARAVLTKACETKSDSSLGWLGLGIACLRTGEYREGEQALIQANIYDPINGEVWGYMALLCLHDGERMVQAHQALRDMLKCEIKNPGLLEELADKFANLGHLEIAETLYKKLLDNWHGDNTGSNNKVGLIHLSLAKIYQMQDRLIDAKLYYLEALKYLEGDTEKEKVMLMLNDIKALIDAGYVNP